MSNGSSYWGQDPTRSQGARQAGRPAPVAEKTPAELEREFYQQQIGRLQAMQAGASERFAEMRAPQEQAVDILGSQAASLAGGAAMAQGQAAREQAQARATQAPGAILGGAIGNVAASGMGALEQEAAARQTAYMRGLESMGAGLVSEAEQRRLIEQEQLRDMQARFVAAQRIAAQKREAEAQERQAGLGRIFGAAGALGGALVGGPAGAGVGYSVGSKVGG